MVKSKDLFMEERSNPFLRNSQFNHEQEQMANNHPLPTIEDLDFLFGLQEDEMTPEDYDEISKLFNNEEETTR